VACVYHRYGKILVWDVGSGLSHVSCDLCLLLAFCRLHIPHMRHVHVHTLTRVTTKNCTVKNTRESVTCPLLTPHYHPLIINTPVDL